MHFFLSQSWVPEEEPEEPPPEEELATPATVVPPPEEAPFSPPEEDEAEPPPAAPSEDSVPLEDELPAPPELEVEPVELPPEEGEVLEPPKDGLDGMTASEPIEVAAVLKVALTEPPSDWRPTMRATATTPARRAYSTSLAPDRSAHSRRNSMQHPLVNHKTSECRLVRLTDL